METVKSCTNCRFAALGWHEGPCGPCTGAKNWEPHPNDLPAEAPKGTSDGGSTSYYKLPEGATDLQDLIEHKKMSFGRGNIFKAAYRLGEKDAATEEYDLRKMIWFAQRRLRELGKPV